MKELIKLEGEQLEMFTGFLTKYKLLFPPANQRPDKEIAAGVFYWAGTLDPQGSHKPSSCGRCYYNARAVLMRWMQENNFQL